jgi:hypothetical protein
MMLTGARRKIRNSGGDSEADSAGLWPEIRADSRKSSDWADGHWSRPMLAPYGLTDGADWHPPAFGGMCEDTERLAISQVAVL